MRIAILEDDPPLAALMALVLERSGHKTHIFGEVRALTRCLRQESYDLLLLDWQLPDGSGIDLLRWAREHCDPCPPTIMVTLRSDSSDIVEALEAGADDYVIKPIVPEVLDARVSAVLRRTYKEQEAADPLAELPGVTFDNDRREVEIDGDRTALTDKEYQLVRVFFRNLNRPMSRPHLLESVWGRNPDLQTRTVDVHVSRVRTRLNLAPGARFQLMPVHGFGYRLEMTGVAAAA